MVQVTDASQYQGAAEGDEPLLVQALQPAADFSIVHCQSSGYE